MQRSLVTVLVNYPWKKKIQQSWFAPGWRMPGVLAALVSEDRPRHVFSLSGRERLAVRSRTIGVHGGASRHAWKQCPAQAYAQRRRAALRSYRPSGTTCRPGPQHRVADARGPAPWHRAAVLAWRCCGGRTDLLPKFRLIPGECPVEDSRLMIICPYPFCDASWKSGLGRPVDLVRRRSLLRGEGEVRCR
jgi:hypothetical protein